MVPQNNNKKIHKVFMECGGQSLVTLWTIALQTSLSMGFSGQEPLEWVTISSPRFRSISNSKHAMYLWRVFWVIIEGTEMNRNILFFWMEKTIF